jgi:hypothetical protein
MLQMRNDRKVQKHLFRLVFSSIYAAVLIITSNTPGVTIVATVATALPPYCFHSGCYSKTNFKWISNLHLNSFEFSYLSHLPLVKELQILNISESI